MKKMKVSRPKNSETNSDEIHLHTKQPHVLLAYRKKFGSRIIVNQIAAISKVTFHELIREKILWSSMAFGILAVILSIVVTQLSYTDNARIALDFGMTSIAIIGGIISIMMGSALVTKELQNRTHFIVLTKPVFRWQFIIGRWLGLFEVLVLNSTIMCFMMLLIFWQLGGVFTWELFQCLLLLIVEFGVLASVASIFSTFTTTTLASIITAGIWLVGHAMEEVKIVSRKMEQPWLQNTFTYVTEALPDLTRFDIKMQVSHMLPISDAMVLSSVAYGLAYMGFALIIACFIFSKKEL